MHIAQCLQHSAHSTMLMCLTNSVFSFQDNLRCFGVKCDMSRITRFLCYFLRVRRASVLSYYAFPSLGDDDNQSMWWRWWWWPMVTWLASLGGQRGWKTKSRGPKGLQLEVGPLHFLLISHQIYCVDLGLTSHLFQSPLWHDRVRHCALSWAQMFDHMSRSRSDSWFCVKTLLTCL